jgi:hypothetical protein
MPTANGVLYTLRSFTTPNGYIQKVFDEPDVKRAIADVGPLTWDGQARHGAPPESVRASRAAVAADRAQEPEVPGVVTVRARNKR